MSDERPQYCPRCGAEAPAHGQYCAECGADLLAELEDEPQVTEESGGRGYTLLSRRDLLLSGGLLTVGGLGGWWLLRDNGQSEHRIYGEGWDVERAKKTRSVEINGSVTIPEGRYAVRQFRPQVAAELTVSFEVTRGDAIDMFVVDDGEYDRYRDRDRDLQLYGRAQNAVADSVSVELGAGEYRVIFDNTAVYGARPSGEVVADVTITASL